MATVPPGTDRLRSLADRPGWNGGANHGAVARRVTGARGWVTGHPVVVDGAIAALVFAASVWGPLSGDRDDYDDGPGGLRPLPGYAEQVHGHAVLDSFTVVLLALAAGSLVLRRRFPVPVWAITLTVAVVIVLHQGTVTAAVAPSFLALFTVGERASGLITGLVTASTAGVYATAVATSDSVPGEHLPALLGFTGAAAALGVAVAGQRAAVRAAEARARQAEVTREEEAQRRVTDERVRIAQELHDVVAHHISVINVQAGVARHLMERRPDQAADALTLVREASRTVLAEMSTVLGLLRSPDEDAPTQPAPGLGQLGPLVETMRRAGLAITARLPGSGRTDDAGEDAVDSAPVDDAVDDAVDLAAYRIVQESLTNALKHGTGRADLAVSTGPGGIRIEVTNPVPAVPAAAASGGHGLVGMHERVAAVGGRLTVGPTGDGRFSVVAELPRTVRR